MINNHAGTSSSFKAHARASELLQNSAKIPQMKRSAGLAIRIGEGVLSNHQNVEGQPGLNLSSPAYNKAHNSKSAKIKTNKTQRNRDTQK